MFLFDFIDTLLYAFDPNNEDKNKKHSFWEKFFFSLFITIGMTLLFYFLSNFTFDQWNII